MHPGMSCDMGKGGACVTGAGLGTRRFQGHCVTGGNGRDSLAFCSRSASPAARAFHHLMKLIKILSAFSGPLRMLCARSSGLPQTSLSSSRGQSSSSLIFRVSASRDSPTEAHGVLPSSFLSAYESSDLVTWLTPPTPHPCRCWELTQPLH